ITTLAVVLASGAAHADFVADFNSVTGINGGVQINGQNQNAGHYNWTYDGAPEPSGQAAGQFQSGSFSTFCIELQGAGQNGQYTVTDIRNAPNPTTSNSGPYDLTDELEVKRVIAAAQGLGWLNFDLSSNGATNAQLAAVQAMVWRAVLDDSIVDISNSNIQDAADDLQDWLNDANNAGIYAKGLRAMVSATSQDQLFVVPVPTAAFAGLVT
ncbi:unnamed protein product, partial [Laminaria digitata]